MINILAADKRFRWRDLAPVLGFVLCAFAFYPGLMTSDTLDQLNQANTQRFNDWHPPLMAWLWSRLNMLFPAASGFLFLDLFLLWFGLFMIERSIRSRWSAWIYLLGFMPFVINLSGVIWKDVATAYALMWAAFCLLRPRSRTGLLLFSLSIFVAIGLRYNALFSCLPLIIGYFWLWFRSHPGRCKTIRVLVVSAFFFMMQLICLHLFNYQFLNATRTAPQIVIMVDDLAYMSTRLERSLVPGVALDEVTRNVRESVNDNIFRYSHVPDYAAVKASWMSSVRAYPQLYLTFRSKVFLRFLGLSLAPPFALDEPSFSFWLDSSYQRTDTNTLRRFVGQYVQGVAKALPFFFTGLFWLLVAAVVFCVSVATRLPYRLVTTVLALSAGINIMSYLLVANAPIFRYYYWSILAGSLAAMLLVFGYLEQRCQAQAKLFFR